MHLWDNHKCFIILNLDVIWQSLKPSSDILCRDIILKYLNRHSSQNIFISISQLFDLWQSIYLCSTNGIRAIIIDNFSYCFLWMFFIFHLQHHNHPLDLLRKPRINRSHIRSPQYQFVIIRRVSNHWMTWILEAKYLSNCRHPWCFIRLFSFLPQSI